MASMVCVNFDCRRFLKPLRKVKGHWYICPACGIEYFDAIEDARLGVAGAEEVV